MLTFDPQAHAYYWQGRRVPNVTSIIAPLYDYSNVPADKLEQARQEGVAIHKMVELAVRGTLDVAGLPGWLAPYHQAWLRFVDDMGFEAWSSERKLFHPDLRYAGTSDLTGICRKAKNASPGVFDVKRSFAAGAAIGVQLAAYQMAWNKTDSRDLKRRYALRFRPGAPVPYHLIEYTDPQDGPVFLAHLTIQRWKEKHRD